jgi:hypothetical protein
MDGRAELIHVMDREGDQFRVMNEAMRGGSSFVIRAMQKDRVLAPNEDGFHNIADAAVAAPIILERRVRLTPRDKKYFRYWANQAREGRPAHLRVAATSVEIIRGAWTSNPDGDLPRSLPLNVVRVFEADPPPEVEPVEWVLVTNLPIQTEEQVAEIVDCYRMHWQIEELFKAIKTGCKYEKLQLESRATLENALALILPVAWQMLLLRGLSRSETATARDVLTSTQLDALRAASPIRLPPSPSARDVLLAIAGMGGHIKNNGDSGWLVLYRGFRDLVLIEYGWRLRCDQS